MEREQYNMSTKPIITKPITTKPITTKPIIELPPPVPSDYDVYIVTWNVGTHFPDDISLRNLFGLQNYTVGQHKLPDIYVFGLQEVNVELKQQVSGLFKEDPWTEKATSVLRQHDYVTVKTQQMQGILLSLYCRRQHLAHLRDIEAEYTRTGFGGIWGNKGAVSIRFRLYGCGLVFVVAHLAAHDHKNDDRIEDYNQILEKHRYHVTGYEEIFDHDYIWWFGDLNFRVEGDDTPEEVHAALLQGREEELLTRDQLTAVRSANRALHKLSERLPTFMPTFKFKEGTSEYDLKRRPAWCDRILYACKLVNRYPKLPLNLRQHSYKSHPIYNMSDHKPVSSEFTIKLFPNIPEPCVVFSHIDVWFIDKENRVEYTKPNGFEERKHDKIVLFEVGFSNLRDRVGYEYVNQADSLSSSDNENTEPTHHRQPHFRRLHSDIERITEAEGEKVRFNFNDSMELKQGQAYQLIYFQSTGARRVTSIAGISNQFLARKFR